MLLVWFIVSTFVLSCESKNIFDIDLQTSDDINYRDLSGSETGVFDSYVHMTPLEPYPNVCYDYESEKCAKRWLDAMDIVRKRNSNRMSNISYRSSANITTENAAFRLNLQLRHAVLYRRMKIHCRKFKWRKFKCPRIKRMFKLMTATIQSKDMKILERLIEIGSEIKTIYNHGKPCFGSCLKEGEGDIVELFRQERDYDKLEGFWTSWRDVTGRKIKKLFVERMNLENIGAKENGYSDAAWFDLVDSFEETDFNETVTQLYKEILPLYKQLHGFVRYCMLKYYPGRFDGSGDIPAHILGNVWAQQWQNIMPILQQCQGNFSLLNIQDKANKILQKKPVKEMFEMAEEFYTSLGMFGMTDNFWDRSAIEKIPGRLMDCHGSASNFVNTVDYRILMCTKQNLNDFTTIHHEMGHIEYYMAYRNLPYVFQSSANPGFHEAIGDTIALSVKTPEHLQEIGLISEIPTSSIFDIDYLLATSLEKVAFLPFALMMDSYVWSVYNGSVGIDKLNEHWWKLRHRYQGIKPPTKRSENDFDAGAKYHIAFGRYYIRYFVSFLLQFQFYEAMCNISGYHGPLHRCDFYKSRGAGKKLLQMLAKGRSQNWRDTLEILTGDRDIKSQSLMRFFDPLYAWLKKTNERLRIPIGW